MSAAEISKKLSSQTLKLLQKMQVGELTEHLIYTRVANIIEKRSPENAAVLRRVGEE